nr:hypothetical protein Iba_chr01aCG0820 [Ipomoea batatas]
MLCLMVLRKVALGLHYHTLLMRLMNMRMKKEDHWSNPNISIQLPMLVSCLPIHLPKFF